MLAFKRGEAPGAALSEPDASTPVVLVAWLCLRGLWPPSTAGERGFSGEQVLDQAPDDGSNRDTILSLCSLVV